MAAANNGLIKRHGVKIGMGLVGLSVIVWWVNVFFTVQSEPRTEMRGRSVRAENSDVLVTKDGITDGQLVLVNAYQIRSFDQTCYYLSSVLAMIGWIVLYGAEQARRRVQLRNSPKTGLNSEAGAAVKGTLAPPIQTETGKDPAE
jgi:hypothetical protein